MHSQICNHIGPCRALKISFCEFSPARTRRKHAISAQRALRRAHDCSRQSRRDATERRPLHEILLTRIHKTTPARRFRATFDHGRAERAHCASHVRIRATATVLVALAAAKAYSHVLALAFYSIPIRITGALVIREGVPTRDSCSTCETFCSFSTHEVAVFVKDTMEFANRMPRSTTFTLSCRLALAALLSRSQRVPARANRSRALFMLQNPPACFLLSLAWCFTSKHYH